MLRVDAIEARQRGAYHDAATMLCLRDAAAMLI